MDPAVLLIILAGCLTPGGTAIMPNGHVFTSVNTDDTEITEQPLFVAPEKVLLLCAWKCDQNENCQMFTFRGGMCLGYPTVVMSHSSLTDASASKMFWKKEKASQSQVAEALKCQQTGVKQLTIPSLGLDVEVYCDNDWMVFLKRQDGSVDFYRNWQNYTTGFGSANGEYWLGLENIHRITQFQTYELRVDLRDWNGNDAFAIYSNFSLASKAQFYTLHSSGFLSGPAGDSLAYSRFTPHLNRPFSTWDADHDGRSGNCAELFHGAWWYSSCHSANLCGDYKHGGAAPQADGVSWESYRGTKYSFQFAQMKIRPAV